VKRVHHVLTIYVFGYIWAKFGESCVLCSVVCI